MKSIDVIIFCGQSNMQGQSEALISRECVAGAYEYKYLTNSLSALCDPVGENIKYDRSEGYTLNNGISIRAWISDHIVGSACYGHTNLVPEFCKAYLRETDGKEVLAVHVAKGSTEIAYWLPEGAAYKLLVEKSLAAIEKIKETHKVAKIYLVWLQGESDAIARRTKEYYKDRINLLCNALKKDIGINKFGVIRVGRFTNDERDLEIINAQDEVCLENNDFLMLTDIATTLNEMPEYMNPYVGGHYSAEGLKKLGYEAGKSLAKYKKQSEDK